MELVRPGTFAPRDLVVDGINLLLELFDPVEAVKPRVIGMESVENFRLMTENATRIELELKRGKV
eukprot:3088812-Rhodomonas_salina.2